MNREYTAFSYALGGAVGVCWIASVGASIYSALTHGDYETPIMLHGLMGTVVGSVFADARLRKAKRELGRRVNDYLVDDDKPSEE